MAVKVSAIIPAHNEADIISETVRAVLGIPGVAELIVVDDGSSDCTADAARAGGACDVVVLRENSGKGGALNSGWTRAAGEVLLLLDADLGASASEARKLLCPVLDGEADMAVAVLGRSELGDSAGSGKLAPRSGGFGLVVRVARLGIRVLTGRRLEAPIAGPRAVKREIVEKAGGFAPRFGVETGLTIDALRMGCRVVEVPVGMVHRASGRDVGGFVHRGGQMLDVLLTLGRKALRL